MASGAHAPRGPDGRFNGPERGAAGRFGGILANAVQPRLPRPAVVRPPHRNDPTSPSRPQSAMFAEFSEGGFHAQSLATPFTSAQNHPADSGHGARPGLSGLG